MPDSESIETPAGNTATTVDRATLVRDLFDEVADLDEASRNALLDARCGPNAALRAEVESLLAHDVADTSVILRSPLVDRERIRSTSSEQRRISLQRDSAFVQQSRKRRLFFALLGVIAVAATVYVFRDAIWGLRNSNADFVQPVNARSFLRSHLYGGADAGSVTRAAADHALDLSYEQFADDPVALVVVLVNIGRAYEQLGDHRLAASALQPAAELAERELGTGHEQTLAAQIDLARVWGADGRVEDEGTLLEAVVQSHVDQFGDDDPRTLATQHLLAQNRIRLGQGQNAATLLDTLFERCARVHGEQDERTLQVLSDLASTLIALGRLDDGAANLDALLVARLARDGSADEVTLQVLHDLASVRARLSHHAEAAKLFERAYGGRRALHGDDHPDVIASLDGLAHALEAHGNLEAAAMRYRTALDAFRARDNPDASATLTALTNLCRVLIAQNAYDEAEPLTSEAVDIAERTQQRNPLIMGTVYMQRGETLLGLERYTPAEAALLRAVDNLEARLGPGHVRIAGPINLLIRVYERQSRAADAALWRARLDSRKGGGHE